MPINYRDYPTDWHEISRRIRFERAQNQCECIGQCGNYHENGKCNAKNGVPHPVTGSKVVLTVAHWPDPTKTNISEENLHAWCKRCHLSADAEHHARNRKFGRYHRRDHQLKLEF